MLRNRRRNTRDVRLLKAVLADQVDVDVSGDEHDGHAVEVCRRDTGDEIGGSGAAGRDANADLAACACIAVRRMGRTLLMGSQNMSDLILMFV